MGVRVVKHGEVGVDVPEPVPEHRVVAGGERLTQTELFFQSLGTFLCLRKSSQDGEREPFEMSGSNETKSVAPAATLIHYYKVRLSDEFENVVEQDDSNRRLQMKT